MKMVLSVLIFLPFFAFGQSENPFSVAIDFSPDFYKSNNNNIKSKKEQSHSFKAAIFWEIKKNAFIKTGLRYAIFRQNQVLRTEYGNFTQKLAFDYFEIPIAFRYYFLRKKWNAYTEGSVSLTVGASEHWYFRDPHLLWGTSLGLEYLINPNTTVFLEPSFRKPFDYVFDYKFSINTHIGFRINLNIK